MKKKILSIVLCIAVLFTMFTCNVPSVSAQERTLQVLNNDTVVTELTLEQSEKEILTVNGEDLDITEYQWQILLDTDAETWVNIYDKTEQSCEISYAVVKNMLDDTGSTSIRCACTTESSIMYSQEVGVSVVCTEDEAQEELSTSLFALSLNSFARTFSAAKSDTDYVTITVNYLDGASLTTGIESAIYSPYVATIEKESSFSQNVISPTFLGFAPYYDGDGDGEYDEDGSTISLQYDSVTEDVVINVYYKPIKVNYAIRYFFQNINDDLYTENVSLYHTGQKETGTLITDEELKNNAGDTTGFEKLYHYPESIAADGSTVFECYYDRNYYLLQFDLDGGYGVEPIYARYGSPFIVNEPVRAGYVFTGWELVQVDTDGDGTLDDVPDEFSTDFPSEIPAYNCYFKALWAPQEDVSATVVYWLQNPDSNEDGTYGYSYWESQTVTGLTAGTSVSPETYWDASGCDWYDAYEHQHYTYNKELTEAQNDVQIKGDGTSVLNVYYDRTEYTLQFVFARTDLDEEKYQIATSTNSDNFAYSGWISITPNTGNWGTVTTSTNPECKSFESDGHKYYYFEIKDKYGARIDDEWVAINNLLAEKPIDANGNVYVSWRTNSLSGYGQVNSNKNIKGAYPYMDETVIVYDYYDEASTDPHIMPAYYNSGVSYYQYEIYFKNGDAYELQNAFIVNPTAPFNQQSSFDFEGMTLVNTEYWDRDASGNLVKETQLGTRPNYSSKENPAVIRFYFDPNTYELEFYNYNTYLTDEKQTVSYGSSLKGYKPEDPPYPDILEDDAYEFAGWYTTFGCYDGTEVNWESDTMPANNIVLSAKWVPVVHTVNFFKTYEDMLAYEAGDTSAVLYSYDNIVHGNVLGKEVINPTYTDEESEMELIFAGWFYMSAGEKKAFTVLNMPINRDMNVFADWGSNLPQPYRISYVLRSDPSVKMADDTYGFAYGGTTRTFNAKAGNPYNQLYEEYNSGYFPTVSSHSITMQYEADKTEPQTNVFTFEYVQAKEISYKVQYVNKITGQTIAEADRVTDNSVITERFMAVENMVPDAFYKRLVLSVEYDATTDSWVGTDDNVITFYYTPSQTSAYYAVHFMLAKLDATEEELKNYAIDGSGGYEETAAHVEGVGDIGETIAITPQEFAGFKLVEDQAKMIIAGGSDSPTYSNGTYEIKVTASGTELYIFYERQSYDYSVKYYHYNTTELVDAVNYPVKTGTATYGTAITEVAAEIPGYSCVSASTEQTITIRDDAGQNEIIFYYSPLQYVVEYIPVPEEGGWLSNTIQVITGGESITGSTPTANPYFEFEGWYADEVCTVSAADYGTVLADHTFVPDKDKLKDTERNIFYAKFSLDSGDLTIDRKDAADISQVFVYKVENTRTGETITVTVTGNDSVTIHDLPFGEYVITEQNEWSWRYTDDQSQQMTVSHNNTSGTTAVFRIAESNGKWLTGNSSLIQNIRGMRR